MLNPDTHLPPIYAGRFADVRRAQFAGERSIGHAAIVLWEVATFDARVGSALRYRSFAVAARNEVSYSQQVCRAASLHHVPLVTRDRQIRKSKIVPMARKLYWDFPLL